MSDLKGKEGGCLCGSVRFRLEDEPMYINACHCLDCQRISGGALIENVWIEESNVTLLGDITILTINLAGSGKKHEIFCYAKCGTDLWSKYEASTNLDIMVRVVALDDPTDVKPSVHIFTRSKQK